VTETGTAAAARTPVADWQRLDPRMLAVTPIRQLFGFLPVIVVVFVIGTQGQDMDGRVFGLLAGVLAVVAAGMLRWLTTRYRITDERVELRAGLLFRTARSVPRDRIRSVDLTAGPVHRLFRLSVVRVGTGEHAEGLESRELTLDAVSAAEADRLRRRLLDRVAAAGPQRADSAAQRDAAPALPAATELAALDWSWLRFAPLTTSSLVAVGAVGGAFAQFFNELGVSPADLADLTGIGPDVSTAPLWLGISLLALVILVIAVLGSLLIFVEAWWRFRLVREPGGTLRIHRGLLTTRSVSLEERRLRGVEVTEPPLLRLGRGARLTAVATGLGGRPGQGRGVLLPPAPRQEAHRVAGAVLAEDRSPSRTSLRSHPGAALRRRLVRAVLPVLAAAAVLWLVPMLWPVAPVPSWIGWVVLGLLPVTGLLAVDAYRNLGHQLTSRYLVTRYGAGVRRTVALQRSGVIGWTVSQSLLQRRAGLVTLTATTAAGGGAYHVIDVGTAGGLAVAEDAVPGLLGPFLHREKSDAAVAAGRALGSRG
jgi:putative membrane protein